VPALSGWNGYDIFNAVEGMVAKRLLLPFKPILAHYDGEGADRGNSGVSAVKKWWRCRMRRLRVGRWKMGL